MKKILNLLIIIVFITSNFSVPEVAHAETLGDLKEALAEKQQEYKENEEKKELTEAEIAETNAEIKQIKANISQTYVDMETLEKDIETLQEQINEKKTEVKKILNFVQVSSGESAYLEYIFGATSFTDLIYRFAVAEQMSEYNEKLISEYNDLIDESKAKQEEISKKQAELASYQEELEEKSAALGEELEATTATSIDIEDEIEAQKEIIETYKDKGCTDDETLSACIQRTTSSGVGILPKGTAFYRPLVSGHVVSEWGTRYLAGSSFHEGIDMGVAEGSTAYAIGTGVVASIFYRNSCGGNMVVVHHNINGTYYTSVYAHLLSIAVSKGQAVTKDTIIGYTGGYSTSTHYSSTGYDSCTYGAHLHLTVAKGLYGIDYTSWSQLNYTYSINPRTVINYPSGSIQWNDRITAY